MCYAAARDWTIGAQSEETQFTTRPRRVNLSSGNLDRPILSKRLDLLYLHVYLGSNRDQGHILVSRPTLGWATPDLSGLCQWTFITVSTCVTSKTTVFTWVLIITWESLLGIWFIMFPASYVYKTPIYQGKRQQCGQRFADWPNQWHTL